MVTTDDLVTVAEAAKMLNRSIEQVRRYLREGKLGGKRIGQQWFIPRNQLKPQLTKRYEEQMALLAEIRKNRESMAKRGLMFDGTELVRESREERDKELDSHLS